MRKYTCPQVRVVEIAQEDVCVLVVSTAADPDIPCEANELQLEEDDILDDSSFPSFYQEL